MGDRPTVRHLSVEATIANCGHVSVLRAIFHPAISMFEQFKAVSTSHRAFTWIGSYLINKTFTITSILKGKSKIFCASLYRLFLRHT